VLSVKKGLRGGENKRGTTAKVEGRELIYEETGQEIRLRMREARTFRGRGAGSSKTIKHIEKKGKERKLNWGKKTFSPDNRLTWYRSVVESTTCRKGKQYGRE